MQKAVRRWPAVLWLLALIGMALCVWIIRPPLESSILAMLPQNKAQPLIQAAQDRLEANYSKRLVIIARGQDAARVRAETRKIARRLTALPIIKTLTWQSSRQQVEALRRFYTPHRFQVLSPDLRATLTEGHFNQVAKQATLRLFSPFGAGPIQPVKDPFGLLPQLMSTFGDGLIRADHGLLRIDGAEPAAYLTVAELDGNAFDMTVQRQIMPVLDDLRENAASNRVQLVTSGLVLHAAAGAKQAKSEISTIGVISLMSVLALTLLVFRSVRAPLLIGVSVATGCLTAIAVTTLVFGQLHLIALAFGAGLVGVSVDYGMHYLAAQRETSEHSVLRRILPGLALGVGSSVLAYAAQALAPFPGLRQMACFSAAGLAGAWLTVVLWYPLLTRRLDQRALAAADWLAGALRYWPTVTARQGVWGLSLLAVVALLLLWSGQTRDDVRLLQSTSPGLMGQERQVQALLQQDSASRFMLVTGRDTQQLLQREEVLVNQLRTIQQDNPGLHVTALSNFVPSIRRQQDNEDLVNQLYRQEAGTFFETLGKPRLQAQAMTAFHAAQGKPLTVAQWLQSPLGKLHSDLWLQAPGLPPMSTLRLSGITPDIAERLTQLAGTSESVFYVDSVDQVSRLLSQYRIQISGWVTLAYAIVGLFLLLRYRRQCWRVMGPPMVAGLLVAGVLSHLGEGLNLFNVLALLLVLGIGLDMGIFLRESDSSPHIWVAVLLSLLTSLLAFGLLVLSETPILHHFGLTVLLGLSAIGAITLTIRTSPSLSTQEIQAP
ncbi:MMPL family transporter [Marinobacter mangrovi]|uniref:MMPL family transporter n=1 Tax=Marinobacter mangrovi TaxID=2803918 RepID=UPI00193251A4|nr:MMPL family transporter [Marinobacter mangrovi]